MESKEFNMMYAFYLIKEVNIRYIFTINEFKSTSKNCI